MKIAVVTVTYGDRFKYLKQVIFSAFSQGVYEVIVVSNGSHTKTLQGLSRLKDMNLAIKVIENKKNLGSASGFRQGIKATNGSDVDFIWLLDDDNRPLKGALEELKTTWKNFVPKKKESITALLSYREDRKKYREAIGYGDPYFMLGPRNSFLGFSIAEKIKHVFRKDKTREYNTSIKVGPVAVAPYGGLFFHSSLIKEIGLPNPDYFLYGDDYDFTFRITKKEGVIDLVLASKLEDLEKSFHLKEKKSIISNRYIKTESVNRIYYSVRNGIRFEQNFIDNRLAYIFNGIIYLILIFLELLINFTHFWKFKFVLKGVTNSWSKQ